MLLKLLQAGCRRNKSDLGTYCEYMTRTALAAGKERNLRKPLYPTYNRIRWCAGSLRPRRLASIDKVGNRPSGPLTVGFQALVFLGDFLMPCLWPSACRRSLLMAPLRRLLRQR